MPAEKSDKGSNTSRGFLPGLSDCEEYDDSIDYSKTKVECICPKCGQRHVMSFHWIGRGTPRKFCQLCKNGF